MCRSEALEIQWSVEGDNETPVEINWDVGPTESESAKDQSGQEDQPPIEIDWGIDVQVYNDKLRSDC